MHNTLKSEIMEREKDNHFPQTASNSLVNLLKRYKSLIMEERGIRKQKVKERPNSLKPVRN